MAVELILPAGFASQPVADQSRHFVCAQRKLILAHNAEGERMALAEFRRRQRAYWEPRLEAVGAVLAEHRTRNRLWGHESHGEDVIPLNRGAVAATLSAAELDAIDPERDFTGSPALGPQPPDPTEDYTSYDSYDEGSDLTITESQITATNTNSNLDYYVRRDCGSDHFGGFEHLVDIQQQTGETSGYIKAIGWALSQTSTGDAWDWIYTSQPHAIFLSFRLQDTRAHFYNCYSSPVWDNYDGISAGWWYPKLKRADEDSTIYAYLYDNSERSSLQDTLSLAATSASYRYIYGAVSYNHAQDRTYSFQAANLDLQEVIPFAGSSILIGGGVLV